MLLTVLGTEVAKIKVAFLRLQHIAQVAPMKSSTERPANRAAGKLAY